MRSGLFWKLFLLQVLAASAVLAGALMLSRSFSVRGFADYLETRERERVQQVAGDLAQKVAEGGTLVEAFDALPRPRRPMHPMPPPRPPPGEPRKFQRRFIVRHGGDIPPLQLQDPAGNYLAGDNLPPPDMGPEPHVRLREPIEVDGKVIGYLAWPRLPMHPEQAAFAHRQAQHLVEIVPVALLLSALFAALITAIVVRPIRALSAGTAALARREFSTRLPADRRDELGALAADFNRLAAALEGYDTRQRQWLADIAHELRTPLSVLRGEIEAVLDGVRAAGPETMRSLQQEVGRLSALIQDLHLVSLAESGGLSLSRSEQDVGELVKQAVARFQDRLAAKGFTVNLDVAAMGRSYMANVDPQRLDQVFANLLENVLHHATPGPVTVSARAEGSHVVVSIADSGPGVPAEALPRLFDRLYRVESARTRAAGGAGLGLSICKSIVEAHGGTIEARAAGGGLEIVLRLPCRSAS
jgi:two-component system sensor histidine kinase BaeS